MPTMPRIISLTILTTLIVFLGIVFFQVVAPFLLPLFLAGVVTIICQPVFRYFLKRTKERIRLASALTTLALLLLVMVPLLTGILIGSLELYTLTQESVEAGQLDHAVAELRQQLDRETLFNRVRPYLNLPIDPNVTDPDERLARQRQKFEEQLTQIQMDLVRQLKSLAEQVVGIAGRTLGKTFSFFGALASQFIALLIFLIALYYFLADGPALIRATEGLIPVHIEYQRELLQQFEKVVRAIVLATFLAALGQGIATSFSLFVIGRVLGMNLLCHFFIFLIMATLASLIPLAGTCLVWGPCAAWLIYQGHWGAALILAVFGVVVVGALDNVIRAYVLQNDTKLHPLLAFVSVLGGLQVMGFWGVFIGPIVACCLHALAKIINAELQELSKDRLVAAQDDAPPQPKTLPQPETACLGAEVCPETPAEKNADAVCPTTSANDTEAINSDVDARTTATQTGQDAVPPPAASTEAADGD